MNSNAVKLYVLTVFLCFAWMTSGFAQGSFNPIKPSDSTRIRRSPVIDSAKQIDAIDVLHHIFHSDSTKHKSRPFQRLNFSIVPSAGYSLSTGLAADVVANTAFYTSHARKENLSSINGEFVVDTRSQLLLISRSDIWGPDNSYNFTTDIRLEKYPTDDYGLGTQTTEIDDRKLVYNYVRVYGTYFKRLVENYYLGLGYNYDHHYRISEIYNPQAGNQDFALYGSPANTTSSGVVLDFLFDNRKNSINPLNGGYVNVIYRQNASFLGSDASWRSLLIDLRKYIRPVDDSNNILGFWSMIWLSSAETPYLDLPATGQDTYNNSGRGYIQGRFRGRDMFYIESEYRFGITHNGLLGGVVFANGQTFTNSHNKFDNFAPAAGTGLRIKVNKHSNTNVSLDYAVGIRGSRGLFVNLGEVF